MSQPLCEICGECPKPPLPKMPKKPNIVSFTREPNGDVRITITAHYGRTLATEVVNKHHWISDVLNVTIHSERPGDYHAWLSHHDGEKDILEGRRGGY